MTTGPLLTLTGVTHTYPGRGPDPARTVLHDIHLDVRPGETVGLVGESGSGKSTLARIALGLLAPTRGTVRFAGDDPYRWRGRSSRSARARLQFVPQHPYGSLNPALPCGHAVSFALRAQGVPRRERPGRTAELLRLAGLDPALAPRRPRELSGGQLQRVAVARALATDPSLVICDEPTSALDPGVQARLLDLLGGLQQSHGLAYLLISHDLAVVRRLAHRVVVLRAGRVVEQGPADRIWDAPAHPYTRALLAAADLGTPQSPPSPATPPDLTGLPVPPLLPATTRTRPG
ncbi:ABC transporter ATP-binding protein [Streptomyces yaizuensis]|uniref:ABC transporter ATP-binding protein n=1 Tax=Streptomyces yaizuensis TaxID=2989713 RepID=A0ABQ5NRQ1_9ACTN|nr:ATP-binding cassette domain-containing protein [Streptomyces sp. YSPA8]GLF93046.1 ABC transporter ATP-binding protein [Streptomyces sp. YSPA8]